MGSVVAGLVMWAALFWLAHRAKQRALSKAGARSSTGPVSGNERGPKWEQDVPYPECFDEMEDDL